MSIRIRKVESLLKQELSGIIQKHYQHHGMITVSEVSITPDLSIAKVFMSLYTPGLDAHQVFEQLSSHETDIRYRLAQKIRHQLRKVPELHFFYDDRAEKSDRMEQLFDRIHQEESGTESANSSSTGESEKAD